MFLNFLKFLRIISFPKNFLDKPQISQKVQNFGKSGNTGPLVLLLICILYI